MSQLPVMPPHAPLYLLPPFEYINIRRLSIIFETDPESIRKVVPEPLEPHGNTVVLWIENRLAQRGQFIDAQGAVPVTNSLDVSVDVPVKYGQDAGVTWAFMYVPPTPGDGDARMALGRELQGAPKKQAYISFREELIDDRIFASVSRLGVEIISTVCKLTGKLVTIPPLDHVITVKRFPSMDAGAVDLRKVVTIDWQRTILASKGGEVEELHFGRSEADPVYWLQPRKIHGCLFEIYKGRVQHTD